MASKLMSSEVKRGSEGDADLTTEHSILIAKIDEISRQCAENRTRKTSTLYQDTEFPLLVNETVKVENKIDQWLRPSEIQESSTSEGCDWALFRETTCNDVLQGELPDCWFLTAAASIAEKKFLLDRIFPVDQLNPYGVYGFKLCVNGDWREVIIDDKLPCDSEKQLMFAKGKRRQLWVPLLEKAIAKLLGGYSALHKKTLNDGMRYLTGCAVEGHFTAELRDEGRQQALWERLRVALQDGFIVACSTYPKSHTNFRRVGLSGKHGYSFLAMAQIGDVKLFLLRNIWGKVAFNGDWSEGSDKWRNVPENLIPPQGKGNSAEGIFWMSMEDFIRYFASLLICIARENYYEHSVKAKLFQEGDTSWDALELEIFDTAQVDINLQPIDRELTTTGDRGKLILTSMIIFDQNWEVIGSTPNEDIEVTTWRSKLLTEGKYQIYVTNFNHLVDQKKVKYTFICHTSKKVKCTRLEVNPEKIATILVRLAASKGTALTIPPGIDNIKAYQLPPNYSGGSLLAIVNRNQTKSVCVMTAPQTSYGTIYSTRSIADPTTKDVIPANCSQIVQFLLTADENWASNDNRTSIRFTHPSSEEQAKLMAGSNVRQKPTLTFTNRVIHRLVQNSELA
ncbi:calpain-15-like [Watersipora subatra]|uniref:calpain-15-like n=1 Tax=Watersipora subatra TaxID=2589382 RepID=UPI00355C7AC7